VAERVIQPMYVERQGVEVEKEVRQCARNTRVPDRSRRRDRDPVDSSARQRLVEVRVLAPNPAFSSSASRSTHMGSHPAAFSNGTRSTHSRRAPSSKMRRLIDFSLSR